MSETTASVKAEEKEKSGGSKTKGGSSKKAAGEASFNMDELRDLAELVNEHGFTDFEFENENIRVRLSKMTASGIVQSAAAAPIAFHQPADASAQPEPPLPKPLEALEEDLFKITSPIVGTFYRSSGPDKEPYVSVGDHVSPESVVCIVEAMKLMNEIQAETNGEIAKIYVENGQPVEFGQPLFGIRK